MDDNNNKNSGQTRNQQEEQQDSGLFLGEEDAFEIQDENGQHVEEDEMDLEDDQREQFEDDEGEGEEEEEEEEEIQAVVFNPPRDDSKFTFVIHNDSVFSVKSHPIQSNIVASGGGDDCAYVWDLASGTAIHKLSGHKDSVSVLGFSSDGAYLATGALDATVKVWELQTGKELATYEGLGESVEWLKWHPKGNVLVAGDGEGSIWLWNPAMGTSQVFSGHAGAVLCGCFPADGRLICSGGEDGTVRIWSPKTNAAVHNFSNNLHQDAVLCIKSSPTFPLLLTGSADNTSALINLETKKIVGKLSAHTAPVETVAFSPSFPVAITGSLDSKIHIWDLNTLQIRNSCAHNDAVIKVEYIPNQPLFVSCSVDCSVRVWDVRSANCVAEFYGHRNTILDLDVSADGRAIITGSDDKTCRIFATGIA